MESSNDATDPFPTSISPSINPVTSSLKVIAISIVSEDVLVLSFELIFTDGATLSSSILKLLLTELTELGFEDLTLTL